MMKFVIFGPPGAGKGTYSIRLHEKLGIVVVSTGDIFREAVADGTGLGKKVEAILKAGELVPDEVVNEVVKQRLQKPDCKRGFVLDGYPRTIDQAEFLLGATKIGAVLNLIVPDEILIEKLSARRICENCGDIYNVADIDREVDGVRYMLPPMLPKRPGKCDKCGGKLIQRPDDAEEVIRNRLEVYKQQSAPVIGFFKDRGVPFVDVHVVRGPDIMLGRIIDMLKEKKLIE